MSAAAKILHSALEDAVHQLEPRLLPLFGAGTRNAREPVARPGQRTQMAMKVLVALTRFFPEEHRARKAGRQLELIWPPLVLEPRGAAAGKLLNYYFRLRQDLFPTPELALRRALRDLVQTTVDEAEVVNNAAQLADCERRLHILAGFLVEHAVDATPCAHLSPLARLCVWQQSLEQSAAEQSATALRCLLLPELVTVLERCIELCRASDWSLDYFCNSGLARALWQARGAARFGGDCENNAGLADLLEELDDECLDMHLSGCPPQIAQLQQWLVRVFEVVHGRSSLCLAMHDTSAEAELPIFASYEQELASYRGQLQVQLQGVPGELPDPPTGTVPQKVHSADNTEALPPLRITAPLITLLYKLTWGFAAAQQRDWARLCHCAYRVALQYWRVRRPVSTTSHTVLLKLALKTGTQVPGPVLRHWRWQLLQDWPRWTDDTKRPIALHAEAGEVVALEAVPDLLSGSFTTLVQAGRLTAAPSAQACRPYGQVRVQKVSAELLQELALLEKGAAAMRVWPLEQLCTLLIAIYEAHLRDEVELPATLLQDAHRQLVRMLDQAAAWHEVQVAESLVLELEQWLDSKSPLRSACREPGAIDLAGEPDDCEQSLRAHLLSCLGTLASVLERPVRLQLDVGKVRLSAGRMAQLLECMRPLIKFMLLDQSVDARTRNAMHKPRVSTLAVTLRATSATLIVTLGEDSHEDVLAQPELQRLQRRLPKAAGTLVCESRAGRGRSFTFTLG